MTCENRPNEHDDAAPLDASHVASRDTMRDEVSDALLTYFAETPAALELQPPSHDLWPAIASRLDVAHVVPLRPRHAHVIPQWTRLLVAATMLVVATSGITYAVTMHRVAATQQTTLANSTTASEDFARRGGASSQSSVPVIQVTNPMWGTQQGGDPDVYEQEIASLQIVLNDKRAQLKSKTIEIIEQNLKVIDEAIRQSRAALATDPASRFLTRQLDRTRAKKIALLRMAAMLPASA